MERAKIVREYLEDRAPDVAVQTLLSAYGERTIRELLQRLTGLGPVFCTGIHEKNGSCPQGIFQRNTGCFHGWEGLAGNAPAAGETAV